MPHRQPRVSVIVPTYNRAPFLGECLDSLLSQTLAPAQVLVVDDGSTDETPALLERYRGRVEVLRTATQSGKPLAVNHALAHVTGDYVWVFDDDDVAYPAALARLVEPLERSRALDFSFAPWACAPSRPDGRIGEPTWVPPEPELARGILPCLLRNNFLGGAALFLRRSVYDAIGGFDPSLIRSQDYDLAIRVVRRFRGARARGGPTFLYRQHEGLRGSSADRFAAPQQFLKWLQYDRIIVRRLRPDLRPGELLPPGRDARVAARLEQLMYFVMMADRVLPGDALAELRVLAEAHDDRPLDAQERRAVRETAMRDPWYRAGSVYDHEAFTTGFASLAARSALLGAVRREVLVGLRHFVTMEGMGSVTERFPVALRRARALFGEADVHAPSDMPFTPLPTLRG